MDSGQCGEVIALSINQKGETKVDKIRFKWHLGVFLVVILGLFSQRIYAGGFYLPEVGSPGSVGTAGVANVVNNFGTDSALTNPAGMTGLKRDQVLVGNQALIPYQKFDSSVAEAGGDDGSNAGVLAVVPGFYAVKTLGDKFRAGFSVAGPIGGGFDFRDNFVGRYQAYQSSINGIAFSPSVAYRIGDKLSVGAGVSALYTLFNEEIAVNQAPAGDGKVKFEDLDDWSAQGFFGLTFQITDKLMLGGLYRTKSDVDVEGKIKFKNIANPIENRITSNLNNAKISFDYPQVIRLGLKYDASANLTLFADFDWEDWSQFSENTLSVDGTGPITIVETIERNWKDTYHVGLGMFYDLGENHHLSAGVAYDTSPVDDKDRTIDLPLDEQLKFSVGYAKRGESKWGHAISASALWLGDGEVDQTAQGARFKGEFDSNWLFIIGANLQYRF
jgi:long-chain fatty acid transport protein